MAAYLMSEGLARFVSDLRRNSQRGYRGGVDASRQVRLAAAQADDFPLPFTVTWAESVGTSGAWIAWLPAGSLVIGGTAIDITSALAAAGAGYPQGWYRLGVSDNAAAIYLVLTPGTPWSAAFADTPSATSGDLSILVADLDGKAVVQLVDSAIILGGDSHMGNAAGSVAALGSVTFASASDSNVKVLSAAGGTLTVGAYYI